MTARRERRLGALVLESAPLTDVAPSETAAALIAGIRQTGLDALPWSPAALSLRARVLWLRARAPDEWPDWSDDALVATLENWLGPWLAGARRLSDLAAIDLAETLRAALGPLAAAVERAAPPRLQTPAGPGVVIDYARADPTAAVRAQWLYGLDRHPSAGAVPVVLELLSPAGRPIATTADLPGFWRGAWAEVRKEMRGRYPRHDWPEAPWQAAPTTRAKRRG